MSTSGGDQSSADKLLTTTEDWLDAVVLPRLERTPLQTLFSDPLPQTTFSVRRLGDGSPLSLLLAPLPPRSQLRR